MTAVNGFHRDNSIVLRRARTNVAEAFSVLSRPARRTAPWPVSRRQLAVAGGIAVMIFLFMMFFVDAPAARAAMHTPKWLIFPIGELSDFGLSSWFLWPLGILFLALASLPPGLTRVSQAIVAAVMVRVGFLFLAIAVPGLFVTFIKRLIGRARPLGTGHIDPFAFAPFHWRPDYAGLPSGHATTVFAVLVAFGSLWPRARTACLLYAAAIAVSRVVVLAHFPSDVFAGAVVGTVGALMVRRYFALRGLVFSVAPDGRLRGFPGPSLRRIKKVLGELLAL